MTGPAVFVKTTETPQSAGFSQTTGTAFVVGAASYGPEVPTLVRSLGELVYYYGPRSEAESQALFDQCDLEFKLQTQRIYVNRALGAGGVAAFLDIEAGATAKTLRVTAKYKGTFGNSIKVKVVENGGKTEAHLIILNSESEVLETSPEFLTATAMYEWGKTHEAYVVISEGTGYAAGKGSVVKVLAATKLATGANPTPTKITTQTAIEAFPKALGPGHLSVPVATFGVEESVHISMGEHAQKSNRVALCDLKEAAVA